MAAAPKPSLMMGRRKPPQKAGAKRRSRGGIPRPRSGGDPPPRVATRPGAPTPALGAAAADLSARQGSSPRSRFPVSASFGVVEYERERAQMVLDLRRMGIRDERVVAAMARVPRERFVRGEDQDVAYGDHALGIAEGQTISQPFVVARMTELLNVEPTHLVLEVGTGSGYQAAVLAELARDVVTVERHLALADRASALLAELGYENVKVVAGDASIGYPPDAPYDRILVTAASPGIAPELVRQCAPDGLIVAPVGDQEMQHLVVRYPDGRETRHGAVKFVPLRGRAGFR